MKLSKVNKNSIQGIKSNGRRKTYKATDEAIYEAKKLTIGDYVTIGFDNCFTINKIRKHFIVPLRTTLKTRINFAINETLAEYDL